MKYSTKVKSFFCYCLCAHSARWRGRVRVWGKVVHHAGGARPKTRQIAGGQLNYCEMKNGRKLFKDVIL